MVLALVLINADGQKKTQKNDITINIKYRDFLKGQNNEPCKKRGHKNLYFRSWQPHSTLINRSHVCTGTKGNRILNDNLY